MKFLRKILFPFSFLYGSITCIRNLFYNIGIFKSQKYPRPILVVGNLSTGGTGKSPMTMFLIENLYKNHKLSVLSRGYKRKTKGYIELKTSHTAEEVGDEPLQFKTNYPNVPVAVCADRRTGIAELLKQSDMVLLDDAFQHRKIQASYSILLTSYGDIFTNDYILPVGNLRESRKGAKRADVIIVTKCPPNLSKQEQAKIRKAIQKVVDKPVYFTCIAYDEKIKNLETQQSLESLKSKKFSLVTGIANPRPLLGYLDSLGLDYEHNVFADHHNFSEQEIADLNTKDFILTTEKDFMRLQGRLDKPELFYLPIRTAFLENEEEFLKKIEANIASYS